MLEVRREQRVVLNPCSWQTYERLVSEHRDRTSPRFTYSEGVLEIMSPSPEHEELNEAIKQIVYLACEELDIEVRPLGSTTQRRERLQQGVEPDSSFYFGDVERDPLMEPPDLVVEVEISRSALDKLPIFAALGIPEVWCCDSQGLKILRLSESGYRSTPGSLFLPLSAQDLSEQLKRRTQGKRNDWLRGLRRWVRSEQAL